MLPNDFLGCPPFKSLRGAIPGEHGSVGVEKNDRIISDVIDQELKQLSVQSILL
jgi:hypothetical protein